MSEFNINTLKKIIKNLPDDHKDINEYRSNGLVSVLDIVDHVGKLGSRYENYSIDTDDANQSICIAKKWISFDLPIPNTKPIHNGVCLCEQNIIYHHWIKHIKNEDYQLVGSCCIDKFMNVKGKSCMDCHKSHNNRKSNYCNECRIICSVHHDYHEDNKDCGLKYEHYIMKFGKYKGELLSDVPTSYLQWLFKQKNKSGDADFALNLWAKHYLENK